MNIWAEMSFWRLIKKPPKCIFEIGVGPPARSRCLPFWGISRCVLFEPMPKYAEELRGATKYFENVQVVEAAVADVAGKSQFILYEAASCLVGVNARTEAENLQQKNVIEVQTVAFHDYDPGHIDVLLLDCEGAEWSVIRQLKSRPQFVVVEMHDRSGSYVNPYMREIVQWMAEHNYDFVDIVHPNDGSDFVYKLRGVK